jgi:hypothetical protein
LSSGNTGFGHLVALFFLAGGIAGLLFPYRVQAPVALKKRAKFWGISKPISWLDGDAGIHMLTPRIEEQ